MNTSEIQTKKFEKSSQDVAKSKKYLKYRAFKEDSCCEIKERHDSDYCARISKELSQTT